MGNLENSQDNNAENSENIKESKRYFIYRYLNYFTKDNNLVFKRSESFRYLIKELIEVNNEIRLAKNQTEVNRLNKAMKYLLQELLFVIDNNPLFNHIKLERDFSILKKQIEDIVNINDKKKKKDDDIKVDYVRLTNTIITSIISLNKKIKQSDIIEYHFEIILNQIDSIHFDKVDYLIDSIFNESLLVHSPKHLKEWIERYSKVNSFDSIDEYIIKLKENFIKENFNEKERFFIFRITIPNTVFKKIDITKDPSLIIPEKLEEMSNKIVNYEKIKHHLFPNKKGIFFIKKNLRTGDKYKAEEIIVEEINRLFEVYKLIGGSNGFEISNKGLYTEDNELEWKFSDIIINDDTIGRKINKREADDIKDFIDIRNKKLETRDHVNELFLLERAYNLISNSKGLTLENQLLNSWLAMEHLATPYISESIIEKIRQIIPKVVSMYYLKGRMNELWEEINNIERVEKNEPIYNLISEWRNENDSKYNKIKFGEGLKNDEKAKELIDLTKDNVYIVRIIKEINGMLKSFKSTQKKVKYIHDTIYNDLNRIYRIRNKIVHSGKNVPDNINLITLRLLNYNTRIMGTIIHYMKYSNDVNIEDILNSIVETYNWYVDVKTKELALKDIITPQYLYL